MSGRWLITKHGRSTPLVWMRQTKDYPPERVERAAARALHFRTLDSGSVASILRHNLDQQPLPGDEPQQALPLHENIRGGGYYH